MPRKAYIADVATTISQSIPGIHSVAKGSEDGDLNVCFVPMTGPPIEIGLLALDVSEYPSGNTYMISTISEGVPEGVNGALEQIQETSAGVTVPDLITTISTKLRKLLASGARDDPFDLDGASDAHSDVEMDDDDDSIHYSSDEDWGVGASGEGRSVATTMKLSPRAAADINRRIRSDLRAVKLAGFKIGILSGMKADSISNMLSISVQVAKLGLSDEAIQAWDLEPQQYIVLLVKYSSGYKDFDTVIKESAKALDIEFRIGYSNKYKPTMVEAVAAFTDISKDAHKTYVDESHVSQEQQKKEAGFIGLFISSSMNEFINQQFISLLKIRSNFGISWLGAKSWFNEKQSRMDDQAAELPENYYIKDPAQNTLPEMLAKDHLEDDNVKQISFPLIAVQFALRYLVRCTEFCLVCHDKIEEQFDALKPYVCSKPLCLYQYMSLGFGPSVEHEILTQPYVVDLLVSFCYSSALGQRLREYPTGMSLIVPTVTTRRTYQNVSLHNRGVVPQNASTYGNNDYASNDSASVDVMVDLNLHEVRFDDKDRKAICPVRNGDWVVVSVADQYPRHYRVNDISLYPTIKLSDAVNQKASANVPVTTGNGGTAPQPTTATPATTPPPLNLIPAKFQAYNSNFDDMGDVLKAETIVMLLETLPTIREMREFLSHQSRRSEPNLRVWKDRISPAALGLLRWIIASNRSCIVQVDKIPGQHDDDMRKTKVKLDQRIAYVGEQWVQFRFAQGAPDKEQRFLNALRAQQSSLDPKHPTLFAWHGSPLPNWHSIIRSGLDFKETLHGRAYGHGVYHAMDQNTSVGYAGAHSASWQGSSLNITSAMSLNEIVNCPSQFASKTPYLVVQHIDWIQCRYLLVQASGISGANTDPYGNQYGSVNSLANPTIVNTDSSSHVAQDPSFTAKSTLNKAIGVPQCAISTSKLFRVDKSNNAPQNKRRKHSSANELLIVGDSDSEDIDDLAFLLSDEEDDDGKGKGKEEDLVVLGSTKLSSKPMTDFVPGSLDHSTLPMIEEPAYATPMASLTLNRHLNEVMKIQKKTPIHELGWYIDGNLINNPYQWIVELHSFDPTLPIAKDMKNAGITSVVLELRFGKDYPHSPPFVRVIRPRFLPFMSGGGGHVTAGGAMCMELLTNSGWSAVSSIESVLLQVRMAMANLEPRPARLESQGKQQQRDYGVFEAIDAYRRACQTHGWQVPPDFGDFGANNIASGSGGNGSIH